MIQTLNTILNQLSLPGRLLLLIWVLEMISVPILKWVWGERAMRRGIIAGVLLQAAAVIAVLAPAWGARRTALAALTVVALGWLVEYVGSQTGVPFGRYHYTDRLQPQLGHVPLVIPVAWLMMLPPAWAVADLITGGQRGLAFVALSGLAITAWDLYLDPQMVTWAFWEWDQAGGYMGIPWVNFLGWFLASAAMTALVRPGALPAGPLLLIYAVTWLLEAIGQTVFWGLPQSALVGFAAMGALVVLAWGAQ